MSVILAGLALLAALMTVPCVSGNGASPSAAECIGPNCYIASGPTGGRPADVAQRNCGTSGCRADAMA